MSWEVVANWPCGGDQKRDFDSVRGVERRADKAKEGIEWTKREGYGSSDGSVTDISK